MAKRGVTFNDLKKAGEVRTKALLLIEKYLDGPDEEFKKQLILKLATNALPRLNEHTGQDGGELSIVYLPAKPNGVETQ